MSKKTSSNNWIKFLGTAGARFVMIKQLRASGGLWIKAGPTNCLVDPGPGSLVRCALSKPKLDATTLDAVVLTHRHLDHSNDINVIIEAMTEGGFKKRGTAFVPEDAMRQDTIILRHVRDIIGKIEFLKEKSSYQAGEFRFETTARLKHSCQTFGLKFKLGSTSVCLLADTQYFGGIEEEVRADVVIVNVVFLEPRPGTEHLSLPDVQKIIRIARPKKAILTHFGMSMLAAKPHLLAQKLSRETGIDVQAAQDGQTIYF